MRRALAAVSVLLALILGFAAWAAQGPLPFDIMLTRTLQSAVPNVAGWADRLTASAKWPWIMATIPFAALLILAARPKRPWAALAAPLAAASAIAADALLRLVLFAPRPDSALVERASASLSSGLPSTFGLVYGALFGAALWRGGEGGAATAARLVAVCAISAGAAARIERGGHWPSQMIASIMFGLALAYAVTLAVERLLAGRRTAGPRG